MEIIYSIIIATGIIYAFLFLTALIMFFSDMDSSDFPIALIIAILFTTFFIAMVIGIKQFLFGI